MILYQHKSTKLALDAKLQKSKLKMKRIFDDLKNITVNNFLGLKYLSKFHIVSNSYRRNKSSVTSFNKKQLYVYISNLIHN